MLGYTAGMKVRTVQELFRSRPTIEGAGVHLQRVFAQPEVPKFDPFLLLDDFGSRDPDDYVKGFPWHPHRGIETVTYMMSGEVEHQDSLGNRGVIRTGDVQWMTAGSGIIHQEMPQVAKEGLKGLQLWVNLPSTKKMTEPRYRGLSQRDIPVTRRDDCLVRIIAGTWNGVTGPASHLHVPVSYFDVELKAGALFVADVPSEYTVFVYVYEGMARIGAQQVVEEQYAALTKEGDRIEVASMTGHTKCIVVAGEPIGEAIAWGGPIVMNTETELQQAFAELKSNTFIGPRSR